MNRRSHGGLVASAAITALALVSCGGADGGDDDGTDGAVTLTFVTNALAGGRNAIEAEWIEDWLIPEFEAAMAQDGRDVTLVFEAQGVDEEAYKTKIALDLQSGVGADVVGMDGIWVGEFAEAGYIEPLQDVAGEAVTEWDGWTEIPDSVTQLMMFDDELYGIPHGAEGRVLYYNKELFAEAGLPTEWQPTSWEDILDAGRALKQLDGVTPIQIIAGTASGEATTMQGLLPLLVGTGAEVWSDGQWLGGTEELGDVLEFYRTLYVDEDLGEPILQQEADGRDTSFSEFAAGEIGIIQETDFFWRAVINPDEDLGTAPMPNRDEAVGYVKIPAMEPGSGINGQHFVSMSGGNGRVLNPNSDHPELAWELLAFMNSAEAFEAWSEGTVNITPRQDVNEVVLQGEEMLSYISDEVLPITAYRPSLTAYPEVSVALQEATDAIVAGDPVDDVLAAYSQAVADIVGAENVDNG